MTKQEDIILKQGRMIADLMANPGWPLIENIIKSVKFNAERERKSKLRLQSTRELALYYSGCVDGATDVLEGFYQMVSEAEEVRNQINIKKKQQAEE